MKKIKESKTIWGFPFYKRTKMPKGTMALINEDGDWIGIIGREVLTKEQFLKKYSPKAK